MVHRHHREKMHAPSFRIHGLIARMTALVALLSASTASSQVSTRSCASSHVLSGGGGWVAQCESPRCHPEQVENSCPQRNTNAAAAADYGVLRAMASANGTGTWCMGDSVAEWKDRFMVVGSTGSFDVYFEFDVLGTVSGALDARPCSDTSNYASQGRRACLSVRIEELASQPAMIEISQTPMGVARIGPVRLNSGQTYRLTVSLTARAMAASAYTVVDFYSGAGGVRLRPLIVENGGIPVEFARSTGESCLVYLGPPPPQTLHVKVGGNDALSGAGWASAIGSLQRGLLMAKLPCGVTEVRIAGGMYVPGSVGQPFSTFALPPGVPVKGGYAGMDQCPDCRDFEAHSTILSGDLAGDDAGGFSSRADNAHHVLSAIGPAGSGFEIDGLTIADGEARVVSDAVHSHGGGVLLHTAVLSARRCTFVRNRAAQYGGAIALLNYGGLTIDGCTFDRNSARDITAGPSGSGGAVFCVATHLRVSNSVFRANLCRGSGGALAHHGLTTIIDDCEFIENVASLPGQSGSGGALSIAGESECRGTTFLRNRAWDGGAVAVSSGSTVFRGCDFEANAATLRGGVDNRGLGGAIVVAQSNNAALDVADCLFRGNEAGSAGGAIYGQGGTILTDSTFSDNRTISCLYAEWSQVGGGAIHARGGTTINRCVFTGNASTRDGGAVRGVVYVYNSRFEGNRIAGDCNLQLHYGSHLFATGSSIAINSLFADSPSGVPAVASYDALLALTNCTIAGNSSALVGCGAGHIVLRNCNVWGNSFLWSPPGYGRPCGGGGSSDFLVNSVFYSNTQDRLFAGAGNMSSNPHFAGSDVDPYTLADGSPCTDAGSNVLAHASILTDIAARSRFVDDPFTADTGLPSPMHTAVIDMGAYEFQPRCPGDFNQDGGTDGADVEAFYAAWEAGEESGDINQDGGIDGSDVDFFFAFWEQGC